MDKSFHQIRLFRTLLIVLFLGASVGFANGAPGEPSGETVAVVQATSASGPGGKRTLAPEKPIYSGDRIVTDDIGTAQIRFRDETRFVVGPRSSVVIDKYIFNPDGTLSGASLQMARGAFRFISGNGPKKAYEIDTPTATIGIRGTEVDVAVGDRLGTGALVFKGEVALCSKISGLCTTVKAGCGAALAGPTGELEGINSPAAKEALIRSAFPLVEDQGALGTPFRVDVLGCGLSSNNPAQPPSPKPAPSPTNAGIVIIPLTIIGGVTCTTTDNCIAEPASR